MADKDIFVNVADLKAKLRYWCKTRGMAKVSQDSLMETIKRIPYTVKSDIESTLEAEPVKRWIPCSERMPEKTGYYLVCDVTAEYDNIRGRQDVSKYVIGRHGGHWYGAICGKYITHWMPLPEPPEIEPIPYNPAHRGAVTAEQFEAIWNDESEVQEDDEA